MSWSFKNGKTLNKTSADFINFIKSAEVFLCEARLRKCKMEDNIVVHRQHIIAEGNIIVGNADTTSPFPG